MYKKEKVKGYEKYQVDTNGIVYGQTGKSLKWSKNHRGYCMINFSINGKNKGFAIHTIVAKQFIKNDNSDEKTQVNHINGIKTDNRVENLEWVTPKENMRHSVDVLGERLGAKNPNARGCYGVNKDTGEKVYDFDCLMDAGRYFSDGDPKRARRIENLIWRVLQGTYGKKTYRHCKWYYKP